MVLKQNKGDGKCEDTQPADFGSGDFIMLQQNRIQGRKSMIQNAKQCLQRLFAFMLAVLMLAGALLSDSMPVYAADGTISYHAGAQLPE